ncbi:MAG: 4-(cytidine 5'-diphospho)-2-C-methyl-D-erythritol kinase [Candidatus Nitronauta litoralis]|uniref:4-diphosphocytidyl-2-C-methyl-D-erythritol kinase n=1 Tax=Candidatus Nitronauta litoralis TaxID=2705533 RepID=A0A7T0BUT5_9BACT|nr:MAG: 4-(cytidine 5'-diphospho)-2-C-methyl-D-erythritol kinase [Candidatus Nitronauta litoralis]
MKLTINTPAKINLGLWILGKREDGFHELETLFQMVSLYDTLDFDTECDGLTLTCNRSEIPTDESNLVMRAALGLQKLFPDRTDLHCRIHLEKKIPSGAGLGGGSGNAAGTLLALNYLWDLGLTHDELQPLAAELGSDVPFFLVGPTAIGKGRGEVLTRIKPCPKFQVLLLTPHLSVSTAEVYKRLNLKLTSTQNNIKILSKIFSKADIDSLGGHLHNDLEPVVLERFKEVKVVWEHLKAQNARGVLVSGSGSTVFGIFSDSRQAKQAEAQSFAEDWNTYLAETVSNVSEFLPESVLNYPQAIRP